jgi:hypothetical protein
MTALVWVQILVVGVGTAWLLALIGIVCVGGWYAHTHPTAGRNDPVFQQLARVLRLLTFGLTGVHPLRLHLRTQTQWPISEHRKQENKRRGTDAIQRRGSVSLPQC